MITSSTGTNIFQHFPVNPAKSHPDQQKKQHNPAIFVGQKPQPGAMRLDGLFQLQGDSEVPM
jgi:hypothetical protein